MYNLYVQREVSDFAQTILATQVYFFLGNSEHSYNCPQGNGSTQRNKYILLFLSISYIRNYLVCEWEIAIKPCSGNSAVLHWPLHIAESTHEILTTVLHISMKKWPDMWSYRGFLKALNYVFSMRIKE